MDIQDKRQLRKSTQAGRRALMRLTGQLDESAVLALVRKIGTDIALIIPKFFFFFLPFIDPPLSRPVPSRYTQGE